ncbi:MAG: signal recognition particle-docking protein FtsY [Alphaproteobacteria bacterium]|nr:signal recognition particle-docking protein FtsY [Alphaproteobacteria bacterium]
MSQSGNKGRGFFGRLLGGGKSTEDAEGSEKRPTEPEDTSAEVSRAEAADQESIDTIEAGVAERPGSDERAEAVVVPGIETSAPQPDADKAADEERGAAEGADPGSGSGNNEQPEEKKGWFSRLKSGLTKTSSAISDGITGIFTRKKLDASTLEDFEDVLLQADLGVETATRITDRISKGRFEKGIPPEEVREILAEEIEKVLAPVARPFEVDRANKPHVILMVGVNGSGKTTTIGKLAAQFAAQGKKVMVAAGDTFRAAAIDQLKVWGDRTGATVIARDVGADAAGVAFDALKMARAEQYDVLLIDTAGRLQNKQALMEELEKVVRVISKNDPGAPHDCLLVLDATTGQNAMQQVEVFRDKAGVTGLVMTKLDGTARGGILVSIAARHKLPVFAIGIGEGVEDLQAFDAGEFAKAIASG